MAEVFEQVVGLHCLTAKDSQRRSDQQKPDWLLTGICFYSRSVSFSH
jgi:hypothetical protein